MEIKIVFEVIDFDDLEMFFDMVLVVVNEVLWLV